MKRLLRHSAKQQQQPTNSTLLYFIFNLDKKERTGARVNYFGRKRCLFDFVSSFGFIRIAWSIAKVMEYTTDRLWIQEIRRTTSI
jgi:hypothetical protein